jgi:hypothetical protein
MMTQIRVQDGSKARNVFAKERMGRTSPKEPFTQLKITTRVRLAKHPFFVSSVTKSSLKVHPSSPVSLSSSLVLENMRVCVWGGHIFLFSQKIIKTGVFFTEEGGRK